ncbi:endodeoxyribonuclease [Salmonella enterica subsp. enterica serovar Muenchen]|nr:endodeoxyribonuclease [Salmonella enterica subsp. enterica serovar Muenchen]
MADQSTRPCASSADGKPHQQRPDRDNREKSLLDALFSEDCGLWDGQTTKVWGETGQIIITTTGEVAQ